MKQLFIYALLAIACVTGFAQGRVSFGNDSLHLLVFSGANLVSASGVNFSAYAGQPIPQLGTANQQMQLFTAQLWAGTRSSSLSLVTSVAAGQAGLADGRLANIPLTLTNIPAGTPAFFQVLVFETLAGSFSSLGPYVKGESPIFQATPGAITPNPIWLPTSRSFSTWAPGPIGLASVPEPSQPLCSASALSLSCSAADIQNAPAFSNC